MTGASVSEAAREPVLQRYIMFFKCACVKVLVVYRDLASLCLRATTSGEWHLGPYPDCQGKTGME